MAHLFLSDEWLDAVLALGAEYADVQLPPDGSIVMNQVIREVPFGDGRVHISVDTTSGFPEITRGHRDDAEVTVTTDYRTALSVLVEQDAQAVMAAFMAGKILIEGDLAKLMGMQATAQLAEQHPARAEIARRLRELTSTESG